MELSPPNLPHWSRPTRPSSQWQGGLPSPALHGGRPGCQDTKMGLSRSPLSHGGLCVAPRHRKIAVGRATAPWLAAPDRPDRMARKGRPRPVGLGRGLSRPHSLRASRPMGEIGPEALNSFFRFLVRLNNF
jgi:hypothetical protein